MASALARSAGGVQPPQGDAQRVQDLQQLQREYRHMELNRRAYAEESQQLLRKQQVEGRAVRARILHTKYIIGGDFLHLDTYHTCTALRAGIIPLHGFEFNAHLLQSAAYMRVCAFSSRMWRCKVRFIRVQEPCAWLCYSSAIAISCTHISLCFQ